MKKDTYICKCLFLYQQLPILPGRHQPSIVSTEELNYRVRNGNGWVLLVIGTNSSGSVLLRTHPSSFKGSRQKRNSPFGRPASRRTLKIE